MKSITLDFDERMIESAQEIARTENTTLNEQFRRWLADYVERNERMKNYDNTMKILRGKIRIGYKPTRDQMNER
jgi:hypothetical protein